MCTDRCTQIHIHIEAVSRLDKKFAVFLFCSSYFFVTLYFVRAFAEGEQKQKSKTEEQNYQQANVYPNIHRNHHTHIIYREGERERAAHGLQLLVAATAYCRRCDALSPCRYSSSSLRSALSVRCSRCSHSRATHISSNIFQQHTHIHTHTHTPLYICIRLPYVIIVVMVLHSSQCTL